MDKPENLKEAIEYIDPNFDGMEKYFEDNDESTFASFCHSQLSGGIGMKIRNHFEFWSDKNTPLYIDLKKNHHCSDPDAMSDKIIRGIYKLRKNKTTMQNEEFKNNAISDILSKNQPDENDQEKLKARVNQLQQPLESNVSSGSSEKMPAYIGTKVVCATPMTECTFLTTIKKQEVGQREDINGYLVVYEDGYKSWSPKQTFERAYRKIAQSEKVLIG